MYLQTTGESTNICFDCQRACGGCPWSELDPDTNQPRFQPVPGWTAEKVKLNVYGGPNGMVVIDTYHVTDCPLFLRDEPRKLPPY